jgi:hypothetical protein
MENIPMLSLVAGVTAVGILTGWLICAHRHLRGTTLQAPIVWAGIALGVIALVEMLLGGSSSPTADGWRCLAALGTFCPSMALLGAKKPQDRGWQFVVVTLWLVLALPVVQNLVFSPSARLDLHPAWRWFLMLLIGIGVSNYLPTRFVGPAIFIGGAQSLLLHSQLSLPWNASSHAAVVVALVVWAVASCWIGLSSQRLTLAHNPADQVWLDFRNAFGAVWALRVLERVNSAARQANRPERLRWQGFTDDWDPWQTRADETPDPLQVTLVMLLRRFVSEEWIRQRRASRQPRSPAA